MDFFSNDNKISTPPCKGEMLMSPEKLYLDLNYDFGESNDLFH